MNHLRTCVLPHWTYSSAPFNNGLALNLAKLCLLLATVWPGIVAARSYDDVIASGYIEVAVYENFAPYSFQDAKGEPAGVDVALAKAIADKLNLELRWLWIGADETVEDDLRNAIWKGRKIDRRKADLMMRVPFDSSFSYAIDGYGLPRNELVVMFGPYQTEQWSIARNLEKVGLERNLAIFRFEKIGVQIDTLPDTYFLSAFAGAFQNNVVHYHSIYEAGRDLVAGELAAIVGMRSQVYGALGKQHERFDIDDDGLSGMGKMTWDIGLATSHEFRQLSYAIAEIVEQLVRNGDVEAIYRNQGLPYQQPEYYQ